MRMAYSIQAMLFVRLVTSWKSVACSGDHDEERLAPVDVGRSVVLALVARRPVGGHGHVDGSIGRC